MPEPTSEAEQRYLQAIEEDCAQILGPGMDIDPLIVEPALPHPTGVRLTLAYRLDGWAGETTVTGETIVAAHAELRERLVIDRIRLSFTTVAEPTSTRDEPPAAWATDPR